MKEITLFLLENGVREETLILLLMLPIISTVIGFGRHFVGIRTIGIYTAIVLTYAFYLLGITETNGPSNILLGMRLGIGITVAVYAIASIGQLMTKKIRLHYQPKLAIIISIIAILAFIALLLFAKFGQVTITRVNAIAIILIVTTSEQFISSFVKKNFSSAVLLSFETMIVSLICYSLISWPSLQNFILTYPIVATLAIPFNLIIGKFTGLRLKEHLRFRDLLNNNEPGNDSQQ
ncbi:hypothetical protein JW796_00315 [Candidatus Dojkabacteria bacterium]|nr:hypothetical protein [Candidatus Dojkabacteria bacterium]